jgi:hypothetical protein
VSFQVIGDDDADSIVQVTPRVFVEPLLDDSAVVAPANLTGPIACCGLHAVVEDSDGVLCALDRDRDKKPAIAQYIHWSRRFDAQVDRFEQLE